MSIKTLSGRGFTLVEMLVYISILIIIAVSSVFSLLLLSDLFNQYRAEQLILRSATTALERLTYDISISESIISASSGAEGSLSLQTPSGTRTYATSSDALHVSVDGADQGSLTETGVLVSEARFYAYSDVTDLVRLTLTLSATVGETTVTKTFNAATLLRGSYE